MTCVPEAVIKHYKESRSLISVIRDEISSSTIQGFIVDYNADWIVLQYIYDFHLDGYLLLRRADLTSVNCPATDAFQLSLLEADGILKKVDFDFSIPAGGLLALLEGLPDDKIVILEDESEEEVFLIGTYIGCEEGLVSIKFFSGAARWDDEPATIALEDVTSVSISTNYTLAYERYFQRNQ